MACRHRPNLILFIAFYALAFMITRVNDDYNLCNANEWRVTLRKAYLQRTNMPPPANISQKRVLEIELPKPY